MNDSPVADQTPEEAANPDIVDALRAHFHDEDDSGAAGVMMRPAPPRRRWWVGLSLAAVIVLIAALVVPRLFNDQGAIAEPPGADEWVWVGHLGIQLEVPASWRFDTSQECTPLFSPDDPHVRLGPDTRFILLHGCIPGAGDPPADQPPVVDFLTVADGEFRLPGAAKFPTKELAGLMVRVRWGQHYEQAHPQITAVARRIVDSAAVIATVDNNGCPNTPATSLTPDLAGLPDPDAVAVCQYRAEDATHRLWSSRQLLGRSAHNLGRSLRKLGSEPVEPGGQCNDDPRAMFVTLHLRSGSDQRVVRVNYQGCSGTGIVTVDNNPGMTRSLCQQIFVMPTSRTDMADPLARRCGYPVPTAQPT